MTAKRATGHDAMFGRYRLCGRLAAGGMAEVWAAQLLAPGGFVKPMVIKRVLPELAENPSFLKMLMTEARVAARLSHANVCAVFELGEVDHEYYIAMEYLRGAPLSHLLKNGGALSPAMAVALVAQACDGLHYAHEQRDHQGALLGLVHRDVSPHNLFVTVDGVLKVLDFGIAKVDDGFSERTEEGKVKGKLTYMSPEQLAAEPLDRRTDVWALGVVLWELLTGKRLFGAGGPADTVDGIRNARVPRLASLGPELARLDDVIAVALRVDRTARFASAAELRRAMIEALAPVMTAGSDEIVHAVWERCGAEVRANDRRFEDDDTEEELGPSSTAVERLPLRADHTDPSVRRPDTIQDPPDGADGEPDGPGGRHPSLTSAPIDTSPEIEVVPPTGPTAVLSAAALSMSPPGTLRSPAPGSAAAGFVATAEIAALDEPDLATPSRWKPAAMAIVLLGAAAIGALYAVRTRGQARPAAPVAAGVGTAAAPPPLTVGPAVVEPGVDERAITPTDRLDAGATADVVPTPPTPGEPTEPTDPVRSPGERKPRPDRDRDRGGAVRPTGRGKLFLDARPYATIYVDGKKLGVTPIVGESLSAGDHTVKAVTEDGRTKTLRITVPAGGDVRHKVVW